MNLSYLNLKKLLCSALIPLGFMMLTFMSSCVETKNIVYFQGDTTKFISLKTHQLEVKKIKSQDILAVLISSLNDETNSLLNIPNVNALTVSNFSQSSGMGRSQPAGYVVDSLGFIAMPLIGKIKVAGLTLNSASLLISEKLNQFVKDPVVNIRILNHKFSVLGEVSRPGIYNILEERITIPEALGMAGDLTIFGKRNNILLIREDSNGVRNLIRIDLTSRDILSSKYYYLENNDVLYIEPLKTKATATDQNYQLVPIFTGIVSALGILILNLRN